MEITETTDAKKVRLGAAEALAMARRATDVYVVKGKRVVHFDMRGGGPDDDELLAHLLGPTGNLRAPVVRRGGALLVGFDAAVYARVLGEEGKEAR
ncbi:MAG: hypothetical protein IT372_01920 [Polyangiaceae bacterium]|nr:hypothetical protein [Polyangiaceae bacterium]